MDDVLLSAYICINLFYFRRSAIDDLAREAFTDVGNQLQDRRHKNFIFTFGNSQTEVCRFVTL